MKILQSMFQAKGTSNVKVLRQHHPVCLSKRRDTSVAEMKRMRWRSVGSEGQDRRAHRPG